MLVVTLGDMVADVANFGILLVVTICTFMVSVRVRRRFRHPTGGDHLHLHGARQHPLLNPNPDRVALT